MILQSVHSVCDVHIKQPIKAVMLSQICCLHLVHSILLKSDQTLQVFCDPCIQATMKFDHRLVAALPQNNIY